MKMLKPLLAVLACSLCFGASAQWRWIDSNGRTVFSDRAPPQDVPEKNILKRPGMRNPVPETPASVAVGGGVTAPLPTSNGTDKTLTEKKKQAERQAADTQAAQRKAEEEKIAKLRADSCTRARQAKAGLDAGGRMARTNAQGEREFLDDHARAQESARIQTVIDTDCR